MIQAGAISKLQIAEAVHAALQGRQSSTTADPLAALALHRQVQRDQAISSRQASQQLLLAALAQLADVDPEGAQILRLHYWDDRKVHVIARQLSLHEGTVNKKQREAIAQLAELICTQEEAVRADLQRTALARLEPPTYLQLFGVEEHVTRLAAPILNQDPPWLYAIEGIGGIGKTTLADSLLRRIIDRAPWCEIAWVTARQQILNFGGAIDLLPAPALTADALVDALCAQLLPAVAAQPGLPAREKYQLLRNRLKATPHLVVIDNLETVADAGVLLAHLRDLANPSKFVLTSRDNLFGERDLHHFQVPDLDRPQALALVRFEATIRNLPGTAAADDSTLAPIYDCVGGNPLALRLVVGQLHVHTLPAILHDLAAGTSRKAENLYNFIYRRAWDSLDTPGRRLLLAMPLTTSHGGDLEFLATVSGCGAGELHDALDLLVMRNLVDARGELHQRRYSIHSLTRTFLQEQVIKWQTLPQR